MSLAPDTYMNEAAAATDDANTKLVAMEYRSFDLDRTDPKAALALLLSNEYQIQKEIYSDGMRRSNDTLMHRAETQLYIEKRAMYETILFALALCVGLTFLWVRQSRSLIHHTRALGDAARKVAEVNEHLETRVRERTAELHDAHSTLHDEMRRRLAMEVELRQAHKLEAVGRLASGVAHEINTPVQFVSDSIHFLREATGDLISVVHNLQTVQHAVLDGSPSRDAATQAAAFADAVDLPYLVERVPEAFARSLDGLARVATIVRSMKQFAHPDTVEMSAIDLNAAVDSTLVIACNEYKYVADVTTELGEVAPVRCYAGEVNQAILNIIVNAAQAIGEAVGGSGQRGQLTLRTRQDGDHAVVSISDSGGGIPEHIRDRIFDPFFTTKDVGKGTGQGLAIVRSVVEKHGGTVTVDTELGRGTTFHMRLPLDGGKARMPKAA